MKNIKIIGLVQNILTTLRGLSRKQAAIAVVSGALIVGSIGTGGYLTYRHFHKPLEVIAEVTPETEEQETETETETEAIALVTEQTEEPEAVEVVKKCLSLVGSSMEKDMKIKIEDENKQLVSGAKFEISVKPDQKGAKSMDYQDKDEDGIIYIKKIEAGNYTVDLKPMENFDIQNGSIKVTVKDKIEYKKVDVVNEVKKESQVNTKVEDTAVKNVPVEKDVTDTYPLLASDVKSLPVDKSQVDQSKFTAASASSERNKKTLNKTLSASDNAIDSTEVGAVETIDGTPVKQTVVASASVSLPQTVTLYNCDNQASASYALSLAVEGDSSLIRKVEWYTSDSGIVTLSAPSGNQVTVSKASNDSTGSAVVKAIVTYDSDDKGGNTQETIQTNVNVSSLQDAATPLLDKTGQRLYTDKEAKNPAVIKDFSPTKTFYIPQYTGWQTIDGKVYYYTNEHQALTGNQTIGGSSYTFAPDGHLEQSSGTRGIDVSKWQGNIDWGAVAASGISFAIIRVGYRGASSGLLVEDPCFKKNIAGATRAGIKVGVYFFTQAVNEAEAVEEASMAVSCVAGYKLSLPIFIDTESATNGRANKLDVATRTAVVKAFCQTVANSGYRAGVYASKDWYNHQLHASSLNSYCIWVAQYNTKCTYTGKYDIWQNTSKGKVNGIKGYVDIDLCYMN